MVKKEILFIIGNSGSGKSYLTSRLINYPMFYKMQQYTTRKKRDNEVGNEYYFINKEHYKLISDRLISTTTVNNEYYGTIPVFEDNKIAIIIVNKEGFESGLNYINKNTDIEYRVLYLKNTEPFEERESRNKEFVENEMRECKEIVSTIPKENVIELINNPSNRVPIEEIVNIVCESFKRA